MGRRFRVAVIGLLLGAAAHAAEPKGCEVHKGLYDSWLSLAKRGTHSGPRIGALLGASRSTPGQDSAQDIYSDYRTFFQCLSDTAVPTDEDGGRSICKQAAADRIGALACQVTLYVKTGRTAGKELLDALPASKKGAEIIWDLDAIATAGVESNRFPSFFAPQGPAFKIIDEVFMLALDNRETAMAKYFHIVGAASGAGAQYTDSQIKVLLRESPALVVEHWAVIRQYQPVLKKVVAELLSELSAQEMKKVRQGIAGVCNKDNLDCPEIQKFFGLPE
jgi:hypothetical protein